MLRYFSAMEVGGGQSHQVQVLEQRAQIILSNLKRDFHNAINKP